MKLYKILMRHCAPKDCAESFVGFRVEKPDKDVMEFIDKTLQYGLWKGREDDREDPIPVYDDNWNQIGTETYLEKMLRVGGELFDEDASYDDAYYGVTHYGWEDCGEVSDQDIEVLQRLSILFKSE
jgi:hypothetical protein